MAPYYKRKVSIWDRIAGFIFGLSDKPSSTKKPEVQVAVSGYYTPYRPKTPVIVAQPEVVEEPESEEDEPSELDCLREDFAIKLEKEEQRIKKAEMWEARWQRWIESRERRSAQRFKRALLRDERKQYRQDIRDRRENQRQTDDMIRWLMSHSTASEMAGMVTEMAEAVLLQLKRKPEVVQYINQRLESSPKYSKDGSSTDVIGIYFSAIESLTKTTIRLEDMEELIADGVAEFEKEPDDSNIPY